MASRPYAPRHCAAPTAAQRSSARTTAAVVTTLGAAAALATLVAAPAEASTAHRTVWDRVASCESSNDWHIDTGNGFYGGLQFSSSTWRAYGGHKYAGQADDASRPEQIEVARRVLKSQGAHAWPVCGPRAGLNRGNGHATSAALPSHPTDATAMSSGSARKSATHKSVKHTSTKHTPKKSRHTGHGVYVVRSGDTLSSIAARHHVKGGWQALYRANRAHLHNPDRIKVGQHLTLP